MFLKSAYFQAKKKQKKDIQTAYGLTIHYTPLPPPPHQCCTHLYAFTLLNLPLSHPTPPLPPLQPPFKCVFLEIMCQTAESSNMQQKHNAPRFCLPIIYKIKNSILFTQELYFNFQ